MKFFGKLLRWALYVLFFPITIPFFALRWMIRRGGILKWVGYAVSSFIGLVVVAVALTSPEEQAGRDSPDVGASLAAATEESGPVEQEATDSPEPTNTTVEVAQLPTEPVTSTPEPTSTNLPEPTPTNTPQPEETSTPTNTPEQTSTSEPTATSTSTSAPTETLTPEILLPAANSSANLRSGPSTDFDVVGGITEGQQLQIVYRSPAGDWYQLGSGSWIFASLVNNAPADLPIAPVIPEVPTAAPAVAAPASVAEESQAVVAGSAAIDLYFITNRGEEEVLGILNGGTAPADISGGRLEGDRGEEVCVVPAGTILQPGQTYHVATGDSWPPEPGTKCGDKPIWRNSGEDISFTWTGGAVQRHLGKK